MSGGEECGLQAGGRCTPRQWGAIRGEFRRLLVADRSVRLGLTARLLGLPPVESTRDLSMGDAGRLVAMLRGCESPAELARLAAAHPTLAELLGEIAAALIQALAGGRPRPPTARGLAQAGLTGLPRAAGQL